MEPFAELVRRDPASTVFAPGAADEVLKIQQYAGDTTRCLCRLSGRWLLRTGRPDWPRRSRLGVWSRLQLSLTGKVVVVRSVLLPLLLHLACVFRFGSYQACPDESGLPLLVGRQVQCTFYLAGFFRHLEALTHVVPRADVRSPAYEAVVRFFRQCPPSISRAEALDHRALYARLAGRQVVSPSGVPAGVRWGRVSGGSAPAAVRDLHWRCALGRLPVREVLHRHVLRALCPRGCGAPETVPHAFWGCPFAGKFWELVLGLLRRVGPGFVLSGDGVVFRRGLGVVPAVSAGVLWDVLGYAKWVLWEDRMVVVGKRLLFGRGRARAPPPVPAAEPPLVGEAPLIVPDLETPRDWGDTDDPGDGAEGWDTKPARKRPLSGEHQEEGATREAPSIPLDNRYGALAVREEGLSSVRTWT
ncbi:hypothetical protein AAFF_G00409160 [Aldrovandia affinis]|uniref:Reverse transcriptase zinc-binding domain-containing protein n=1 Tax=Aldrovandia affinis TaxID=143900 RepID=A0AAD7R5Q4_9TELE|nr:hypothetical protein AAFF_G00409160 [Aldrovandia affinis]